MGDYAIMGIWDCGIMGLWKWTTRRVAQPLKKPLSDISDHLRYISI